MTTTLTISMNASRSPSLKSPAAYSVALADEDRPARPLRQIGPVENGVTRYSGTFLTRNEAMRAAVDVIAVPCKIIEDTNMMDDTVYIRVVTQDAAPINGYNRRVLASISNNGTFISA